MFPFPQYIVHQARIYDIVATHNSYRRPSVLANNCNHTLLTISGNKKNSPLNYKFLAEVSGGENMMKWLKEA